MGKLCLRNVEWENPIPTRIRQCFFPDFLMNQSSFGRRPGLC
uniref:Uncharacterized protein n=1 Tax=Anguilla anguilla TaxID=7936 RepID=A0A0E9QEC1_ANGAN